jgi:acetyl esterase/lipase
MTTRLIRCIRSLVLLSLLVVPLARAQDKPDPVFDRKADVIYGRLPGLALTMDVFTPKADGKVKQNGAGVIWVVSGGWASARESIDASMFGMTIANDFIRPLVERGYTVFAVVHGSQPKYTIPEILPQINRAVRFIRHNGKQFGIDGERLGIIGASAGGHLSLMQGISPEPANDKAPDPVDRASSKVQAVAAFVPPTDFLNYGGEGIRALGEGPLGWLRAPFDFVELHTVPSALFPGGQQAVYERVTDIRQIEDIGRRISPVYHVDKDDAPTLVLHGEVDRLVPLQQVQSLKKKLDEAKVPNELFVREKADHAWVEMGEDMQKVADWFDKHLVK